MPKEHSELLKQEEKNQKKEFDNLFDSIIYNIAGDLGLQVANLLLKHDEITDEELASILDIKVNFVRKVLYKLYENNLATYRRVRDKETGWFIFYWKLNPEKIYDLIRKKQEKVLAKLTERLNYEKSHMFYICKNCSLRLTFEESIEYSFHCPKCGALLQQEDNSYIIKVLEKKIEDIKNEIKTLKNKKLVAQVSK